MAHKILVIDDDRAVLDVFHAFLTSRNYVVDCALDMEEAKSHLGQNTYSVVVADLSLGHGEMEGLQVLEYLAREPSKPRIVVCSGHTTTDIQEKVLVMGADMFLAKPFVFKMFLKNLEYLLSNASAEVWPLSTMQATEGVPGVQHSDCR
jgi:two-component system response regulator (stage 0 sporulation protein A)